MIAFSHSALLQALGWATLNSFWQVGVLWCGFALIRRYSRFTPSKQYALAVFALSTSLVSFVLSFCLYLQSGSNSTFAGIPSIQKAQPILPTILTAASVSYLLLLAFPTARLVQNWRFLRRLRRQGLHKAPVQYRLYVKKISSHLGLHKPVQVHLSALISSPVTIGFFKPLILLPVASFNQLSLRQAEAILLHELAHIRRFDYLINIGITFTQTLLYFNPFIRLFVRAAETSREECCDRLVLQFDYDRVAYASALLQLEKSATPVTHLALAAAGKNQLLSRIQAILGQGPARPSLRMHHFTGLLASVLCAFALHSFFISTEQDPTSDPMARVATFANPLTFAFSDIAQIESNKEIEKATHIKVKAGENLVLYHTNTPAFTLVPAPEIPPAPPEVPIPEDMFIHVAHKEQKKALAKQEMQQVAEVVNTTKKVLSVLEWQKMEVEIADALTEAEKAKAHQQYQQEIKNIDWEKMEDNIVSNFYQTDWDKVNRYLGEATAQLQADSLAKAYSKALTQLEAVRPENGNLPLPDLTTKEVETLKIELRKVRDSIQTLKIRPVIKL